MVYHELIDMDIQYKVLKYNLYISKNWKKVLPHGLTVEVGMYLQNTRVQQKI